MDEPPIAVVNQESAWMVVGIIFIILFVVMIAVNVYLCVLRRRTINEIREAHFLHQQVLQDHQYNLQKIGWQHDGGHHVGHGGLHI